MEEANKIILDEEKKVNSVSELTMILASVDINSPDAKLNATTISDNNGGRILL